MRKLMVAAAATMGMAMTAAVPAAGQTLGDTFNQLRSSLRQLGGGKAKGGSSSAPASATETSKPVDVEGDGTAMVPASVVVDDLSDTALEKTPTLPRRVETFDVRGFRLGMSPREAGRIAKREGFRRRWNSVFETSGTFEVEATRLANQKLNRPVERSSKVQLSKVQAFDPSGNEVNIEFTLEPGGPRLSRMTYDAKLNGTSPQQAGAALVAKYGRPTKGEPGVGYIAWSDGDRSNDNASPLLNGSISEDRLSLALWQSVNYKQDAYRRMEARAAAIAAAKGGGVRF